MTKREFKHMSVADWERHIARHWQQYFDTPLSAEFCHEMAAEFAVPPSTVVSFPFDSVDGKIEDTSGVSLQEPVQGNTPGTMLDAKAASLDVQEEAIQVSGCN